MIINSISFTKLQIELARSKRKNELEDKKKGEIIN